MPVGFNSPARNLFLLGSSGAQLAANFFKRIDQSTGTDITYIPDEIRYNSSDQKYILAGSNQTSAGKGKGWFEKRDVEGVLDWNVQIESTITSTNTTLKALEVDGDNNLIVCGKTGDVPWIAKYTNSGEVTWQVTSNTAGVEYTGIAVDSNNNLYACGSSATEAFIEKVSGTGSYSWGKYSSNTAGPITFVKCAANDRGEVVAVGKIEDTIKNKGYIAKVNTTTGELLWDKTIEDHRLGSSNSYLQTECTDVYIDNNDQIYIIGTVFDAVGGTSKGFIGKYTAEGNLIWQKETPTNKNIQYINVKSNSETEQTIVFGTYVDDLNNNYGILTKYSRDGSILWRRIFYTSFDIFLSSVNLDADPSFYYLLFIDQEIDNLAGTPDTYVFGKVSTSGNGLGNFEYSDGIGTVYYQSSNIVDNIGKLYDGSVRNDTSDLVTYPFGANKILFDDLATQVANKKVQVDEAGTYSDPTYSIITSGPSLKPLPIVTDGLVLYLDAGRKDSYSGSGTTWTDLSNTNNNGTLVNGVGYNSANGGSLIFDGNNHYVNLSDSDNWFYSTENFTIEFWYKFNSVPNSDGQFFYNQRVDGGNYFFIFATNNKWEFDSYQSNVQGPKITYSTSHNTSSWNCLSLSRVGNNFSLYLNATLVGSQTNTSNLINLSAPLEFGRWSGGPSRYINCLVSSLKIYKGKGLTSQEIQQNFNSLRGRFGI